MRGGSRGAVFWELKEGSDPKTASQWVTEAVRDSFPGLRAALLPFPEIAEEVAEQFKLDPSRRCALLVFKQYSILQLPTMVWLFLPALLFAFLQLKGVTVQDASINAGFDSAQATALFLVAAFLPTTSAFCGQIAWSAAYNRRPPLDFVPVIAPGSGITALFSCPNASIGVSKGGCGLCPFLLPGVPCSLPRTSPLLLLLPHATATPAPPRPFPQRPRSTGLRHPGSHPSSHSSPRNSSGPPIPTPALCPTQPAG